MVQMIDLWIPILLAAVLIQAASTVLWAVLPWHDKDWKRFSNEDQVREAIKSGRSGPGQYNVPYAIGRDAQSPEIRQKFEEGPVAMVTVAPDGMPNMGKAIGFMFLFVLFVVGTAAYVASRTLPAGTDYLQVFRIVGTVCFIAFSAGTIPASIWFAKPWKDTWKTMLDGLIFGLLAGGAFGWMWP